MDIDILGISEMKWIGSGLFRSSNNTVMYSGHNTHRKNGVGMIIANRVSKSLIGYKAVNDKTIYKGRGAPDNYNFRAGVCSYNQCRSSGHRGLLQ
jgi:hypothetical protein